MRHLWLKVFMNGSQPLKLDATCEHTIQLPINFVLLFRFQLNSEFSSIRNLRGEVNATMKLSF